MARVVIVEDELLVRLGIKMCLEQEGDGALSVAARSASPRTRWTSSRKTARTC